MDDGNIQDKDSTKPALGNQKPKKNVKILDSQENIIIPAV
jgi:hypothetical protein